MPGVDDREMVNSEWWGDPYLVLFTVATAYLKIVFLEKKRVLCFIRRIGIA